MGRRGKDMVQSGPTHWQPISGRDITTLEGIKTYDRLSSWEDLDQEDKPPYI